MRERLNTNNTAKNIEYKSHLIEGVYPIVACLTSPEDEGFKEDLLPIIEGFKNSKEALDVDWNMGKATLDKQGFLNEGSATYVISTIDSLNKFSEDFMRCTGLVVAGTEKRTGKRISLLTHQDPFYVLTILNKDKFTADLENRLYEMRRRCVEGTIDAVVVGGRYIINGGDNDGANATEDYPASLELLGKEVEKVLGFEPTVINGPKNIRRLPNKSENPKEKIVHALDSVYYDTKNNRLYLVRPKILNAKSFPASEVGKHVDEWK